MVLMVGIELKYFGDQLKPTNDIVRKYIFCDYSFAAAAALHSHNRTLCKSPHSLVVVPFPDLPNTHTDRSRSRCRWC